MRTCPKCGRANDVTRKFCVRCGASLIAGAEPAKPKTSAPLVPETGRVTTAASLRGAREVEEPTEREEPTGPEERVPSTGETRHIAVESLRETEIRPSPEEIPIEPTADKASAKPAEVESEQGKEIMRLVREKMREAEARAKEAGAPTLAPSGEAAEMASIREEPEPLPPQVEEPKAAVVPPAARPSVTIPQEETRGPVSSLAAAAVATTADEYLRDEKVRKTDYDIKTYGTERKQLQSDMDKLRARLDPEVERYRAAADAKKARAESIERDLKLAKKEWDDADKEYKNAESHRKKELSVAEKRIEDVDKRIRSAEEAKKKRIEEIEKKKQKLEEESRKT